MSLTTEQKKALTESRYYRPEVGETAIVELSNWRYDEQPFRNENTERRPTLVMDVVTINGNPQNPPKIWSSQGRATNILLINSIEFAERAGRRTLHLSITRVDKRTYHIVDANIVDDALPARYKAPYGLK